MGNYASCALCGENADEHERLVAKMILPGGEIQSFYEPITAAELMLEIPNSFLVNSKSLQIGRRLCPLNADENLEMGNVYVLFGKQRLHSVVSTADMGSLFLAANRASSSSSRNNLKSLSDADHRERSCDSEDRTHEVDENGNSKSNLEQVEEFFSPETKHRLSLSRSRKPLLETIVE